MSMTSTLIDHAMTLSRYQPFVAIVLGPYTRSLDGGVENIDSIYLIYFYKHIVYKYINNFFTMFFLVLYHCLHLLILYYLKKATFVG